MSLARALVCAAAAFSAASCALLFEDRADEGSGAGGTGPTAGPASSGPGPDVSAMSAGGSGGEGGAPPDSICERTTAEVEVVLADVAGYPQDVSAQSESEDIPLLLAHMQGNAVVLHAFEWNGSSHEQAFEVPIEGSSAGRLLVAGQFGLYAPRVPVANAPRIVSMSLTTQDVSYGRAEWGLDFFAGLGVRQDRVYALPSGGTPAIVRSAPLSDVSVPTEEVTKCVPENATGGAVAFIGDKSCYAFRVSDPHLCCDGSPQYEWTEAINKGVRSLVLFEDGSGYFKLTGGSPAIPDAIYRFDGVNPPTSIKTFASASSDLLAADARCFYTVANADGEDGLFACNANAPDTCRVVARLEEAREEVFGGLAVNDRGLFYTTGAGADGTRLFAIYK